jgi:type I restriction enzyme S subunit
LEVLPVPCPPFHEQIAIAELLECWDKAIQTLEFKIGKKKLVKQGLMQKLLSGQTRMPGFAKDWKIVRLGSLGKIISGGTPDTEDSSYWNGGIPWCTPTEFAKLKTRLIEKTDRTLSELGLKKSSATLLPENSVIVCTRATVGACAINSVPMATNQGFKSLVPGNHVDSTFVYYVLTTLKNHFIRFSSGSTFLELSKRDFRVTKVRLPPLDEQRMIAKVLSAADGEIEALEHKLALFKDQKIFLLNYLVTGTIRLPQFCKVARKGDRHE